MDSLVLAVGVDFAGGLIKVDLVKWLLDLRSRNGTIINELLLFSDISPNVATGGP